VIVLRSLGTAEIETLVTTLTPSKEILFAAALYLILERGKRISRTRLSELLWPEAAEKTRSHRLRQTILQIKRAGFQLHTDRDTIWLSPHEVRCDPSASAIDTAESNRAPETLEFLPGYSPRFSEGFSDWVDARRAEVHSELTRSLVRKVEEARSHADWPTVEKIASQLLILDAYNEIAVLAIAEATALSGGKRKAIGILDKFLSDVGGIQSDLQLPATILRRRIVDHISERQDPPNSDPPFVGRSAEIRELTRRLKLAQSSNGSATLFVGDPGIGKSRLSAEIARFAQLQGIRVQRVTCRRTDLDRPLSMFVELASQLRDLPGALGCAPQTLSDLKRLTEHDFRAVTSSQWSDATSLFETIRESLVDLFDSVTHERCLLVIADDIQWLDTASTRILSRMVEWAATKPIAFLLNSRPGQTQPWLQTESAHVHAVRLGPLPLNESAALLSSIALRRGEEPDAEFVQWCLNVAEGNPFFLQELVQQWIETGHRYEAPPSVTKVLHERLSRVSASALQLLQTCAILGEYATLERAERILEYSTHQLLTAVEELSEAAMLNAQQTGPEVLVQYIRPRHDLLASAALARLSAPSQAFIHLSAAEALERELEREKMPTAVLWACASHRHHAGDKARALSLGLACAKHLLEVGLPEEACARYQDSLAYCTSNEDRLALLPRLSTALQVNGEWERSKEALRTCVRLNSLTERATDHNDFELLLFQAQHKSCLNFVTLLDQITPCVESAVATPNHRVSAGVIALKLAADVGPSAKLDSIYFQIKPFLLLEDIDLATRHEAEIIYQTMRGEREITLEFLENFAESARSLHGEIAYSSALAAAAAACRISGRDDACLQFIERAFEHAVSHRLRSRIPVIILTKIRLHVAAEDFVAARAAVSDGERYPLPSDDEVTRAEWQYFEARIALEDRQLPDVEKAVAKIELVPDNYSVARRAGCLSVVLRLRLMQRKVQATIKPIVANLEAAHLLNRDIGNQDFEAHSLFLGLRALGEEKRGMQLLREYVESYRRSRRPLSPSIEALVNSSRQESMSHCGSTTETFGKRRFQRENGDKRLPALE
jgi:DNA-binding SARP family transcriptional activator